MDRPVQSLAVMRGLAVVISILLNACAFDTSGAEMGVPDASLATDDPADAEPAPDDPTPLPPPDAEPPTPPDPPDDDDGDGHGPGHGGPGPGH